MLDGTHIWERQEGEPPRAYEYFKHYRDIELAARRSIDRAYAHFLDSKPGADERQKSGKKPPRAPSAWFTLSQKWKWAERAQAFDDFWEARRFIQRDEEVRAQEAEIARRKRQVQEHALETADIFLKRLKRMLEFPLEKITREDVSPTGERAVYIVNPVRWNLNTAARFAETTFKLYDISTGGDGGLFETSEERLERRTLAILQKAEEMLDREQYERLFEAFRTSGDS